MSLVERLALLGGLIYVFNLAVVESGGFTVYSRRYYNRFGANRGEIALTHYDTATKVMCVSYLPTQHDIHTQQGSSYHTHSTVECIVN